MDDSYSGGDPFAATRKRIEDLRGSNAQTKDAQEYVAPDLLGGDDLDQIVEEVSCRLTKSPTVG